MLRDLPDATHEQSIVAALDSMQNMMRLSQIQPASNFFKAAVKIIAAAPRVPALSEACSRRLSKTVGDQSRRIWRA